MTNAILMSDFLPGSVQLNMAFLLNRLHADFLMDDQLQPKHNGSVPSAIKL